MEKADGLEVYLCLIELLHRFVFQGVVILCVLLKKKILETKKNMILCKFIDYLNFFVIFIQKCYFLLLKKSLKRIFSLLLMNYKT